MRLLAVVPEDDRRRDTSHHTRHAEPLAEQERAVGDDGGERDLDEVVVQVPMEVGGRVPDPETDGEAAGRHPDELAGGSRRRHVAALHHGAQDDGEHHSRGAVVEQALGVDHRRQPVGHAEAPEQRDDRDRVRGGDERGEQQGHGPGRAAQPVHPGAGDGEGDETPGHGERDDAPPVREQVPGLEVEPGLEQQDRQEDVEDEVRRERERVDAGDQAEDETDDHQADGVRDADTAGDDRHRGGDDEEEDERLLDGRGRAESAAMVISRPGAPPGGLDAADAGQRVLERRPGRVVVDGEHDVAQHRVLRRSLRYATVSVTMMLAHW